MITLWLGACAVVPVPEQDPDAWVLDAESFGEEAYASCASCHLADGSGRPDGSVPRLAGQLPEVLEAKLRSIAAGELDLPVMAPFARALSDAEIGLVAEHLSGLPVVPDVVGVPDPLGAPLYVAHCAACHGLGGEGHAGLLAPRVCGQHAGYVLRRLATQGERADADPAMTAVVAGLDEEQRVAIADHLARCAP